MKKYLKIINTTVLSLFLVLSSVTTLNATDKLSLDGTLTALDTSKYTVLNDVSPGGEDFSTLYDENEVVEIIVELSDKPVLDYDTGGDVNAFVTSTQGRAIESKIEASHVKVASEISKIAKQTVEIEHSYTRVLNGISVSTEVKNLEKISELPNVKRAYVSPVYEIPTPQMFDSNDTVDAVTVWQDLGIKGEGTVVGILDTGLDTEHPAFGNDVVTPKISEADVQAVLDANELNAEKRTKPTDTTPYYHSVKVPFRFDYADYDVDVAPSKPEFAAEVDHGTHVAGTVGGFDEKDGFSGVAPEAQLMIFKVFKDTEPGASNSDVTAALDDAVLFDIDVINMSLGSSAGFSEVAEESLDFVYNRVGNAGIVLDISAGNATSASKDNNHFGFAPTETLDHGIVGSPSTYRSALSVASMDNTFMRGSALVVDDRNITYTDTPISFKGLQGETLEYVVVPENGEVKDYANIDVTGKIALVSRGVIAFNEKVQYAHEAGAVAAIIYNNSPDEALINMVSDGNKIPAIFINQASANFLKGREDKTLTVDVQTVVTENTETPNAPSDFSSIGTTNLLEIKPEIAAPGGYIYSTLPLDSGEKYGSMSGTSMASPHVAGISALVIQAINEAEADLPEAEKSTKHEKVELVNQLIMSTATPSSADGVTDPVRKQGAGMINALSAIKSPAYLSTVTANNDGSFRPKLELGDDKGKTGHYVLTFNVTNTSDEAVTYTVSPNATVPFTLESPYGGNLMTDVNDNAEFTAGGDTIVTVDAKSTKQVTVTVTLSEAEKAALDSTFEQGSFVEGYVTLVDESDTHPTLSIPYLTFYGDWTNPSMWDIGNWINDVRAANFYSQAHDGNIFLGANYLHGNNIEINPEMLLISPNGDKYSDHTTIINGLVRNAVKVENTITAEDGTVVYDVTDHGARKTYLNSNVGRQVAYSEYLPPKVFRGTDQKGNDLPDGKYTYSGKAYLGYDDSYDEFTYDIIVDRVAPEADIELSLENGRLYATITLEDTNNVVFSAVSLYDAVNDGLGETLASRSTPSTVEKTHTHKVDITGLLGETLLINGLDSGTNEGAYGVKLPISVDLGETEELSLVVGEEFQVVLPEEFANEVVVWTAEDESVATVEEGLITAVTVGSTKVVATVGEVVVGTVNLSVISVEEKSLTDEVEASLVVEETEEGLYTDSTWEAFVDALTKAQAVLDNPDSTDEDYTAALEALKAAQSALVQKVTNLPTNLSVEVGKQFTLDPKPSGGTYTYDSSIVREVVAKDVDTSLVKTEGVTTHTVFEAVAAGTTTITYTSLDGEVSTVDVTVTPKAVTPPTPPTDGSGDPTTPGTPDTPDTPEKPLTPEKPKSDVGTGIEDTSATYTQIYAAVIIIAISVLLVISRKKYSKSH